MKASKTLISTLVAAAMVGGIGLAYAQTGSSQGAGMGSTQGTGMGSTQGAGMGTAGNSAPAANSGASSGTTTDSGMAAPSTSDTSSFKGERPAQADRN